MPKWPIRIKLIAGLSLVVGMMLTLMGGSIFGLHSFHASNLSLVDGLRELGASFRLLEEVVGLELSQTESLEGRQGLETKVHRARETLAAYYRELKKNTTRGNRADDGRDELGLAFIIDNDLAAILTELHAQAASEGGTIAVPVQATVGPILPGTELYVSRHPDVLKGASGLDAWIDRLNSRVMELPDKLHRDFYAILLMSQRQYQMSRVIVWTAALAVLAMLCAWRPCFTDGCSIPSDCFAQGSVAWRGECSTTRSSSTPATRCKGWPRRSTI